ncbi:MAG: hypothetical protein AAFQ94_12830 [Bacteroidota bacterium]
MKRKQSDNKTILFGCLSNLAVILPWYFIAPWKPASVLAVMSTLIFFFVWAIYHEFKKHAIRKKTPRSVISGMPKYGYVKLLATIENDSNFTTWFTGEQADYRWLNLEKVTISKSTSSSGTETTRKYWSSFYNDETAVKHMVVKDATGSCLVGLHNMHFYIKRKKKTYKSTELLPLLDRNQYPEEVFDALQNEKSIRVAERWVPKDLRLTFYGVFNKLPLDQIPSDLIKAAEKSRKLGALDDEMRRNSIRLLQEADWEELIEKAKNERKSTVDILTADYDRNEELELIMSVKDNLKPDFVSILAYLFAIAFVTTVGLLIVNSQFPEFTEEFLRKING